MTATVKPWASPAATLAVSYSVPATNCLLGAHCGPRPWVPGAMVSTVPAFPPSVGVKTVPETTWGSPVAVVEV